MSRLEEIKNEVVKEFGYKDFITYEILMIDSYDFDNNIIIEKIAKSYAEECVKASLEKASEKFSIKMTDSVHGFTQNVTSFESGNINLTLNKESITNPENIVLL